MIVIELTEDKYHKAINCLDTIEEHLECLREIIKEEESSISMRKTRRYDEDDEYYYPRDRHLYESDRKRRNY